MLNRLLISSNFDAALPGGGSEYSVNLAREWIKRGYHVHVISNDFKRSLADLEIFQSEGRLTIYPIGNQSQLVRPHQYEKKLYDVALMIILKVVPESIHIHNFHGILGALWAAVDSRRRTVYSALDFGLLCMNWYLYNGTQSICEGPARGKCRDCMLGQFRLPKKKVLLASLPAPIQNLFGKDPEIQKQRSRLNHYYANADQHLEKMLPLLNRFDAILTISPITGKIFTQFGVHSEKIHLHVQGILPRPQFQTPLAEGPTTLMYLGHFSTIKGLQIVVRALAEIQGEIALTIKIFGNTADNFIRGLPEAVRKYFRAFPQLIGDQVEEELRRSDGVLVPSLWYENSPYAVLRTLAAGKPVLVSRLEGMTHLIQDDKNGMTIPSGDIEAWKNALIKTAEDPGYLRNMRKNCFFTKTVQNYADEVESVLDGI